MQPTVSFHVFVSLAAMALTWVAFAQPFFAHWKIVAFVWLFLLPLIFVVNKAHENVTSGESTFTLVKLISVIVTMAAFLFFWKRGPGRVGTWVIALLFAVNILEAVVWQSNHYTEERNVVDIANALFGVLLVLLLIPMYRNKSIESGKDGLDTKFGIWYILAYTTWNLLFRSRLIESSSTLIFFTVTLLMPLLAHVFNHGDWLVVRGAGLLSLVLLTFGLGSGELNILPMYNKQAFDPEADKQSVLSEVQQSDFYRYGLLGLTGVFMIAATRECFQN